MVGERTAAAEEVAAAAEAGCCQQRSRGCVCEVPEVPIGTGGGNRTRALVDDAQHATTIKSIGAVRQALQQHHKANAAPQ